MKTKKEKKPHGTVYKRAVPCGVMAVIMAAAGIGSAAAFKSADAINIALRKLVRNKHNTRASSSTLSGG